MSNVTTMNTRRRGFGKLTGLGVVALLLFVVVIAGSVLFFKNRTSNTTTNSTVDPAKKTAAIKNIDNKLNKITIPSELTELNRSSSNPKTLDQPNTTIAYSIKSGTTVTIDSLVNEFESQGFKAGPISDQLGAKTVTLTPTTNQSKLLLIVSIDPKNTVYIKSEENKRSDQ